MRKLLICIALALLSACQPETPTAVLPTRAELPTDEATSAAASTAETTGATATLTEATTTPTAAATSTPTLTPTITRTPTSTATIAPTATHPSPTPNTVASATAAVQEAPSFATITPAPPNAVIQPTTTPIIVADVIITEAQFQEELDAQVAAYPEIDFTAVNFTPIGVIITLTASGGDALITGDVTILFQVNNGLVYITIGGVQINAPQIPEAYASAINNLYAATIESMDSILRQRLGDVSDLENLVLTETSMNITLLVPLSVATNAP
ncbi:MAG: hypothetical protein U0694_04440 [Anaerolineae bacterium]